MVCMILVIVCITQTVKVCVFEDRIDAWDGAICHLIDTMDHSYHRTSYGEIGIRGQS